MDRTPVLILGGGLTVLGVLRSFGRAGTPLYVAPPAERDTVRYSRWYRPAPPSVVSLEDDLPGYLAALPLERAVLVPCSDGFSLAAARAQEQPRLASRFPASVARPEVQRVLLDKARFADLLTQLDIPAPRTVRLQSPEDLSDVPDELLAHAFLKPHDSQSFFARFGVKAFHVDSRAAAAARLAELARDGIGVLLQEYIPGPATCHYFVDGFADRSARIRALFARRRLRMYPPDFGNSTYMRSVPLEDAAEAVAGMQRIVAELGYRGIFSAEFKRDPRDGRFKILEVNARPWWFVEFAARCGVDVCLMSYLDAIGTDPGDAVTYATGRRLVYPYYDFFAALSGWKAGSLSLVAWAASWVGAMQPVFRWADPAPSFVDGGRWLKRYVEKRVR